MNNCGTILAEPTTTVAVPVEPRITPLGDGVFRVGIPGTDLQMLAVAWTIPDAVLTVAALYERSLGIRVAL